jgi:hypothetical protein
MNNLKRMSKKLRKEGKRNIAMMKMKMLFPRKRRRR